MRNLLQPTKRQTPGEQAAEILARTRPNLSILRQALQETVTADGQEMPPMMVSLFPTFLDKFNVSDSDIPAMVDMMRRLAHNFEEIKEARAAQEVPAEEANEV